MKYKTKLLQLIENKDVKEFGTWLESLPIKERIQAMKEFKQLGMQKMFTSQNFANAEILKKYAKKIDALEAIIKKEEELKAYIKIVKEEMDAAVMRLAQGTRENKQLIIDKILNNESDAENTRNTAKLVIEVEKQLGIYDPEFWKPIE